MGKLIIKTGNGQQEYSLENGSFTIGRAKDNDIQLDDPTVSNHHGKIIKVVSTFYVQDLGSTNGILVNGKSTPAQALHHGDSIRIGTTDLFFTDEQSVAMDENAVSVKTSGSDLQMTNSMAGHIANSDTLLETPIKNENLRVVVDNSERRQNHSVMNVDIDVNRFPGQARNTATYHDQHLSSQARKPAAKTQPMTPQVPAFDHDQSFSDKIVDAPIEEFEETLLKIKKEIAAQTKHVPAEPAQDTKTAMIDDDAVPQQMSDENIPKTQVSVAGTIYDKSHGRRGYQQLMSSEEVVKQIMMLAESKKPKKKQNNWGTIIGVLVFLSLNAVLYYVLS